MFAPNVDDFWFDYKILFSLSLLLFFGFFAVLSVISIVLSRFKKLYYFFFFTLFALFLIFYIHSNYLAGFLPQMDGEAFDWSGKAANISSIAVCLVVLVAVCLSIKFVSAKKMTKVCSCISLVVCVMLGVSLISMIATKPVFKNKADGAVATTDGINYLSSDENFLILMIDAVDSRTFKNIVDSKDEYKEMLMDFSYYPDTMSGYAFTRESVPFILSGEWFENKADFNEYATNAFSNSKVINHAKDNGFDCYFYDDDIRWNNDQAFEMKNIVPKPMTVKKSIFLRQEIKYILFKILPFPLKRFSSIQTLNFENSQVEPSSGLFNWHDSTWKDNYLERNTEMTDGKMFQWLHVEGAHVPFSLDENAEVIEDDSGTYEQKVEGVIVIVEKYLDRLKKNGAYDNSTIIILADHGYSVDADSKDWRLQRYNPVLYIKGKGEHHHTTKINSARISQLEFSDAFVELMDGKKSTEIFESVPESGRERRALVYAYNEEWHMDEYLNSKKAWETDGFKPTGNVFDSAKH